VPSNQDKQPPRPSAHIGAELGVDRAPLSERSRRASESAGQASLSYASSGPTQVPAPANVQTDMPPVILDPVTAPASEPPPSAAPRSPKLGFESVSGIQTRDGAPVPPPPPSSASRVVAEPSNKTSGSFAAAGRSGPFVIPEPPPMRARAQTLVVRERRRATPTEKAVAFAAALLVICLLGAVVFWWRGQN
jgi:hypothetical protein